MFILSVGKILSNRHVYQTMCKFGILILGEVGKVCPSRVVPREWDGSPKFESHLEILLRDGCACGARVEFGLRNVRHAHLMDIQLGAI